MFLLQKDFYRIKETKKKGRGVVAIKDIPAGTIIGDYLGIIVNDEKAEKLESKLGGVCYSMNYRKTGSTIFPVDIKSQGVHLLNHACAPNCDLYIYYGHTIVFAMRRILPNEELTIDYSFSPGEESNEKDYLHPCLCGSPFCRGTMYTNAAKLKKYHDFCDQETKGQKFKSVRDGEILEPLGKYPKNIKDAAIFDLYANLKAPAIDRPETKMPPLKELRRQLRLSGRVLNFKKIGLKVLAITDGCIITTK